MTHRVDFCHRQLWRYLYCCLQEKQLKFIVGKVCKHINRHSLLFGFGLIFFIHQQTNKDYSLVLTQVFRMRVISYASWVVRGYGGDYAIISLVVRLPIHRRGFIWLNILLFSLSCRIYLFVRGLV